MYLSIRGKEELTLSLHDVPEEILLKLGATAVWISKYSKSVKLETKPLHPFDIPSITMLLEGFVTPRAEFLEQLPREDSKKELEELLKTQTG